MKRIKYSELQKRCSQYFPILKKHLADDGDEPNFFHKLITMITTIAEKEWCTSKDLSAKAKDEVLRTYAKRGISKKLAKTVIYRLMPDILVECIYEKSETTNLLIASVPNCGRAQKRS